MAPRRPGARLLVLAVLAALAGVAYLIFAPTPAERLAGLIEARRFEEAEAVAKDALDAAAEEERADLLRALGIAHGRQDEHAEAIEAYRAAYALRPEDQDLRHRTAIEIVGVGRQHDERGEAEAALARYREAVELAPEIPHGHRALVAALRSRGDLDASIEALEAALSAGSRDVHDRLALAWLLASHPDPEKRDGERAVELANDALLHDRTPETLDTFAVAMAALGRYNDAVRFELEAIELAGGREGAGFEARRERLRVFMDESPYLEPAAKPAP